MPSRSRPGRLACWIALLGCALPAHALRPVPPGVDAVQVEAAASEILCDCGCHPQSIKDCACGHADMRWDEIAADVAAGKTADQIIADRVERFGEKILVAPKARGFSLLAWIGPGIALILAALGLTLGLRRWVGRTAAAPAGGGPVEPAAVDPVYLERLRRDLEESR